MKPKKESHIKLKASNSRLTHWVSSREKRLFTYDMLYYEQKGLCAACGKGSRQALHLDHDHKTGKIRGLLCMNCNIALGLVNDDQKILLKLMFYLKRNA